MPRLSRKRLAGLAGAGVLIALGAWAMVPPGEPFDPARWRKVGASDARALMADRMVATGELRGKTKAEVYAMLGEKPSDPPSDWNGADVVRYHLGPERSLFSIDPEFLCVEFGPDGRVTRCWIS